jgi:hypothetical protein
MKRRNHQRRSIGKLQPNPAKQKMAGSPGLESGQIDLSKQENFEHNGIRMSMSPNDMLMWNRLTPSEKSKHALNIKSLLHNKKMKYEYKTFINDLGVAVTKYYFVDYNKPTATKDEF